jgi:hypothetical protein
MNATSARSRTAIRGRRLVVAAPGRESAPAACTPVPVFARHAVPASCAAARWPVTFSSGARSRIPPGLSAGGSDRDRLTPRPPGPQRRVRTFFPWRVPRHSSRDKKDRPCRPPLALRARTGCVGGSSGS